MIACFWWKADHELGLITLLVQQPVEDERRGQAPRTQRPEPQAAIDRPAQQPRGAVIDHEACPAQLAYEVR